MKIIDFNLKSIKQMPPTEMNMGLMEQNTLGQMIPLTTQIDFMLQRTYHDLGKLAELLPQKTDLERKIEISAFLRKTKQMFVRLLALVKWTNSANKVDKCGKILSFLQNQQMIFIETANCLARMARETLVHARLPSFSLPCAVDVLTTGSYPRLPHCIKEKIIPSRVILPSEKRRVVARLSQLIEYRIVTTDMPTNMCRPVINNGRVVFMVECEFKVTLTLMSDSLTVPWRLLNIDILVEDFEAHDSLFLVHPQQVQFIHHIAQQRLMENDKPLQDLYTCLHYFCQSLQLEVLYYQSIKLINCKVGHFLKVEEYVAGKLVTISYWRDPKHKSTKTTGTVHKMTIYPDEKHPNKPLIVTHFPKVLGTDSIRCIKYIDVKCLSMESMLNRIIEVRSLIKIKEAKRAFESFRCKCDMFSNPNVLKVNLTHLDDSIQVSVLEMKGTYSVSLPAHLKKHKLALQTSLNTNKKDLFSILETIRIQALKHHYTIALKSSLLEHSIKPRNKEELKMFGKNYVLVKMFNQDCFYLIISFHESVEKPVKYVIYEAFNCDNNNRKNTENIKCVLEIDPRNLYQPFNELSQERREEIRRVELVGVQELNSVVSFGEQTLLFVQLSQQLNRKQLRNTGRSRDSLNKIFQLLLFDTPSSPSIHPSIHQAFKKNILKTSCRLIKRDRYIFCVQISVAAWPIKTSHSNKNGNVVISLNYEACNTSHVVAAFTEDFSKIINTYKLAIECDFRSIQSGEYSIESHGFDKISIFYGPEKSFCTSVVYNARKDLFDMLFWSTATSHTSNCHSRVAHHLLRRFNYSRSLSSLCSSLISTQPLLSAVYTLPTIPFIKSQNAKTTVNLLRQVFSMVSQSSHHLRLFHHSNLFVIDLFTNPFTTNKSNEILFKFKPKKSQVFDSEDHKLVLSYMVGEVKGGLTSYEGDGRAVNDDPMEFIISQMTSDFNSPIINLISLDTFQHGIQACMDNLSVKKYIQSTKGTAGKMDASGISFKLIYAPKKVSIKLFSLLDSTRQWDLEDLAFLERYFVVKVLSQAFNQTNVEAYFSLLHMPHRILKDLVQVIKLELNADKSSKCQVQLMLTQPHDTNLGRPLGTNAIFFNNRNVVFILHLSIESSQISLMLPLCYELQTNALKGIEKHPNQLPVSVDLAIKRASEYASKNNECCILPAIREIINTLN